MLKKAVNLPCPFAGQKRADRIGQTASRSHQLRTEVKQLLLQLDDAIEPVGREAPAPLRIASPCPAARAGRVDEDKIGGASPVRELLKLLRRTQQAGFDDRPGTLGTRRELRQARTIAVRGKDDCRWCGRGERDRLSTRAGAQVENPLPARWLACKRDQLTTLVLNLDKA